MSLTDIMSAMQLSQYPTIALVIFFSAFTGIVIYAMTKRKADVQREANIPLDDGVLGQSEPGARATGSRADTNNPTVSVGARNEPQPRAAAPQRSER